MKNVIPYKQQTQQKQKISCAMTVHNSFLNTNKNYPQNNRDQNKQTSHKHIFFLFISNILNIERP